MTSTSSIHLPAGGRTGQAGNSLTTKSFAGSLAVDEDFSQPMTGQQKLWQGVVMQALMDATQGIQKGAKTESARILHNTLNRERERADTWIRDCGSNFRFVCDLAGMDPYFISDAYRAGRIDGKRLRAKTGEGAV